jgi:translation elongation factor EF-G
VKELMDGIADYGPEPQVQIAEPREVAPEEKKVAGFVFKVQANMDPKHRDRVAFVRLASGHFQRGMKLTHVRSKKADGDLQPGAVPRLRPRTGRGGLGRRHHRHPEPRAAAHRRHADRGRGAALHRHPVLRAGAAAEPAARATR